MVVLNKRPWDLVSNPPGPNLTFNRTGVRLFSSHMFTFCSCGDVGNATGYASLALSL